MTRRPRTPGPDAGGAVMGSILFRLLVAIALRAGLDPVDLKLDYRRFRVPGPGLPPGAGGVKGWGRRAASKEDSRA